jgi:hypothetical protein
MWLLANAEASPPVSEAQAKATLAIVAAAMASHADMEPQVGSSRENISSEIRKG